jgi:lipopolysaccharide heptosyltransferase I
MPDRRFLVVRLGSLGDIIHTLPAAAALRDTFPDAQIDWVVESKWRAILEGNRDLNRVVSLDRARASGIVRTVKLLRDAKYTCALDFQSLYKSSLLAFVSGASERVGFGREYAREGLATLFYTQRIHPSGAHKVEHNLALAAAAGAAMPKVARFTLPESTGAEDWAERKLRELEVREFCVLSPGGGWRSKCWPVERYGALHREISIQLGLQGIVSFGPGEEGLADEVVSAGGLRGPIPLAMDLPQLMAVLRRATFLVAADTGPLHLASAVGIPVVGLFGPTDPTRNGPYGEASIVVRKAEAGETTYKRGASYSPAMMRIEVSDVIAAIDRLLERC